MKKEFIYILGLLALLVGSCVDETLVNSSGKLRITGGMGQDSRTVFVQEGNVTHTHWIQGDRIGLHTDKESNISFGHTTGILRGKESVCLLSLQQLGN